MVQSNSEIPGAIDFNDAAQVNDWIAQTVWQRVWQPRFLAAFAAALNDAFDRAIDVVELAATPGHLAKEIRATCEIASYATVDLSTISQSSSHAAPVDAVLTMPAAHNVCHRNQQPKLFERIRRLLKPEGLLLYCDHYAQPGISSPPEGYLSRQEQPEMLRAAGFCRIDALLELGGMALYRARA